MKFKKKIQNMELKSLRKENLYEPQKEKSCRKIELLVLSFT